MINKELEQYKKSKQASYEALQARCNELEFLNRKLKQECEELRKQLNAMFESYELNCLSENSFCKKYPMVKTELNILRKRHKQVLDEIEEYIKTTLRMPLERRVILDIISKAKGGKNAGWIKV
uniref:hypothetical protein n=1 Tax=Candidatus Scatousia sp. TaxID=3085663 RepID=UPI00402670D1